MTEKLATDGGRPVRDEFLVFGSPRIEEAEIAEVVDSLRSGWIGTGPKVARFEELFREYTGAAHAVAVSSCTAALHLSMIAAGVGPGHEVITTSMTFAATANAIVHVGAKPVLVDIDRTTLNIDPEQVARAITPRTRAVIPVHFAGRPCEMDELSSIATERSVLLIEDAAHCVEGWYGGKKVGTIGDTTCFSFYVTKNMTTIEGGMVTTEREDWARRIKTSALHGLSADAWARYSDSGFRHYQVHSPGFKYNLTDVQAALGIHQLGRVETWLERRAAIWERYVEAFSDLPVTLPAPPAPDTVHARHLFTLLVDPDRASRARDDVLRAMQAENIGCGVHYTALHLHPYYRDLLGLQPEDLPNSTFVSDRTLSIPLSAKLTDEDVADVIAAVRKVLGASVH